MTGDLRWHARRARRPNPFNLPLAVIDEYRDGATCQQLARKYGCSKNKVMYFLHDHNVEMRPKPVPPTRDDLPTDEIIDLYRSGWTFAEIAELYGASTSAIWTRVPREDRPGPTPLPESQSGSDDEHVGIDLERVRSMFGQGMSLDGIAVELEVETDSLREVLRDYGVRIPPRADPDDPKRVQQREQSLERARQQRERLAVERQRIRQRDLKEERARQARAAERARRRDASRRYAAIREGEIEFERRERSQLRDWLAQYADVLTGPR